eukprot:5804845-Alexandrium_andersonii.AAC.1
MKYNSKVLCTRAKWREGAFFLTNLYPRWRPWWRRRPASHFWKSLWRDTRSSFWRPRPSRETTRTRSSHLASACRFAPPCARPAPKSFAL